MAFIYHFHSFSWIIKKYLDDVADAIADIGADHHLGEALHRLLLYHLQSKESEENMMMTMMMWVSVVMIMVATCFRASFAACDSPYMLPNTP